MAFLIGLLTVVLVLDCVVLILLVLVQLPKKEAGAGLAFGGAASDALFVGPGNMLTKITKYAAGIFFVLAVGLGLMQSAFGKRSVSDFQRELEKQAKQSASAMTPQPVESSAPAAAPAASNLLTTPAATPAAAAPSAATNPAPAK